MAGIALNYIGFLASGAIGTIPLIKQHFDSPKTSHTTTVRIGLGHNAAQNVTSGGNLPGVSLWNEQGKAIGSSTGGKWRSQSSFADVQISAHPNIGDDSAAYVSISADNDDAVCVAYVTVSQANGDSSTFTGDVAAKCGATHYESSTTLGADGSHPQCVWISKDQGIGFHVRDFFGTDAQAKAYASNSDLMCKSGPRFRMYRQLDAKDPILFYDPALKYNQDGTDVDPSKVINNLGKLTETDKKRKRDHMSMQDTETHHNGTHHHTSKTWDSMYTSAPDAHSRTHHDGTDYHPSKTWDSMSTGTPEANHRMHHNGTHHHTDKTWASTYTGISEASSRTHHNGTLHHTGATCASTYTDTPEPSPTTWAPTCTDTSGSNPSTWAPTSTDADPSGSTDDSDPSTQNYNKRKRDHMSMESSKTHHNGPYHHTSKTWHSMSTGTHKANHKTHHNGTHHHTSTSWASTPTDTNTDPSSSTDDSDPSTQNEKNRKRDEITMQGTKTHHNGTHSHTHSPHPKTTGTSSPWRFSGTLIISDISTHSASNLCAASNSYGPDFVATKEGKFCDMKNKHLWDVCTEQKSTCCFDVAQKKLQACAGARKRGGISWRQVASVREVVEYTDVQRW